MNAMRRRVSLSFICFMGCFLSCLVARAGEIITNDIQPDEFLKIRKPIDDPTPYYRASNYYRDWVTEETWEELTHDPREAKAEWAKARGFKATDATGLIAPEIKPGKYNLSDKDRLPFKELMPAHFYDRFNEPGGQGTNFPANFTEFEVIPTRQLYHSYRTSVNSIKNEGKAKQDEKGYPIIDLSFETGIPFPKPSGPHAGWQIIINKDSTTTVGLEDTAGVLFDIGFTPSFTVDRRGIAKYYSVGLSRRSNMAPRGKWYDARAEKRKERGASTFTALAPRDLLGTALYFARYEDVKRDNVMMYTPLTRRIRKLSSSDKQDQSVGVDYAYDDEYFFSQELLPEVYPYEVNILEEREYLVASYTIDGESWLDSKSRFLWRDLKMERRPCYLIEMRQLDSNYIYSKRLYWVDKENFRFLIGEFYDQKGRLWRSMQGQFAFHPEFGVYFLHWVWAFDHIDVHSTGIMYCDFPAENLDRNQISPKQLMRAVK